MALDWRKGEHHIFRRRANSEFATPDAYAGTNIVASVASAMLAMVLFIDGVGDEADGPHLSLVGVTAELEIHTFAFGLL